MNEKRIQRVVNGILLLDKPVGMSSNQALSEAKRIYKAKKAGHTGSLDPLANGMLPLCFGEATKFSQFLLEADKQYEVEAKLGVRTTTADAEGEVIASRPLPNLTLNSLEGILDQFRGEISQIPSMFSALKHKGKPLYSYARKGIEIERESRIVTIKQLELLAWNEEKLTLLVTCTKGTYIRTLIDDIGEALGCGAYVTYLRRTYVDPYQNRRMFSLDELRAAEEHELASYLLPVESAVVSWPEITLPSSVHFYLKQGQPVLVPKAPTKGMVRLVSNDGVFVGIGHILEDGRVAPRRLVAEK